ncbi:hypothetical protein [Streptomyces ipomoeae]|uniref:hypothetical protein n=1 Tax=Streptomyces ipomoeae TaxID=103232 RepID=UPI0011469078|nr:hypothetical protein [Streptomyces ipomoeae]MDX2936814.1 hypothetical protein [Streptomyces ipomoeae]TQE23841.1 hypothetical protein SipoB123_20140 [Streptomyces ipomoeae]
MRTRTSSSALTASACALLLALTLTACGDDEVELPMASNTEGVAGYLDKNIGCTDTDYWSGAELAMIKSEISDSLDGGGECELGDDSDIDFLHVSNMTEFQKDVALLDENADEPLMVGMDFALDVDDDHIQMFLDKGLMLLDCDPGMQTPEGYARVEAEGGCVLTNYVRPSDDSDY